MTDPELRRGRRRAAPAPGPGRAGCRSRASRARRPGRRSSTPQRWRTRFGGPPAGRGARRSSAVVALALPAIEGVRPAAVAGEAPLRPSTTVNAWRPLGERGGSRPRPLPSASSEDAARRRLARSPRRGSGRHRGRSRRERRTSRPAPARLGPRRRAAPRASGLRLDPVALALEGVGRQRHAPPPLAGVEAAPVDARRRPARAGPGPPSRTRRRSAPPSDGAATTSTACAGAPGAAGPGSPASCPGPTSSSTRSGSAQQLAQRRRRSARRRAGGAPSRPGSVGLARR